MTSETITIYHNPSCSKSRETLQILEQHMIQPKIIEYLDTPPSKNELIGIIQKLGLPPVELLCTSEKVYMEANFQTDLMSDDEIIDAITKHPSLLQRPIVVCKNKAIIGRPPIKVLDIIFS
jgi:arsenate reductase